MSIGINIKNLRETHELTQKQLAEIAGVTDKAVSMWELNLREPRMGAIQKMADYFGIPKSQIVDDPIPETAGFSCDTVVIPVVGRVSAGNGILADEDVESYEIIPAAILNPGEKYICLRVRGDSMAPKIDEGDRVLVRLQSSVDSGSYAVVLVDGEEGVVKRVLYDKDHIELISENPYYPKRIFSGYDVTRIKIIGQVKRILRDV